MNKHITAECLERLVRLYERDEVSEGTLVGELYDLVYALRNNQGWPIGPTLGDYAPSDVLRDRRRRVAGRRKEGLAALAGQFEIGAALRDKREGFDE